jgi:hypothetical protein
MNRQKLNAILGYVRGYGGLPTDRHGQILSPDDMLVWFGLNNGPYPGGAIHVKAELLAMAETRNNDGATPEILLSSVSR